MCFWENESKPTFSVVMPAYDNGSNIGKRGINALTIKLSSTILQQANQLKKRCRKTWITKPVQKSRDDSKH